MQQDKDAQQITELLFSTLQDMQAVRNKLEEIESAAAEFKAKHDIEVEGPIGTLERIHKSQNSLTTSLAALELAKRSAMADAATAGTPWECPRARAEALQEAA